MRTILELWDVFSATVRCWGVQATIEEKNGAQSKAGASTLVWKYECTCVHSSPSGQPIYFTLKSSKLAFLHTLSCAREQEKPKFAQEAELVGQLHRIEQASLRFPTRPRSEATPSPSSTKLVNKIPEWILCNVQRATWTRR